MSTPLSAPSEMGFFSLLAREGYQVLVAKDGVQQASALLRQALGQNGAA